MLLFSNIEFIEHNLIKQNINYTKLLNFNCFVDITLIWELDSPMSLETAPELKLSLVLINR